MENHANWNKQDFEAYEKMVKQGKYRMAHIIKAANKKSEEEFNKNDNSTRQI